MDSAYTAFSKLLADRPIAFHPILAKVARDAKAGMMLNVLCHWGLTPTALRRGGWFYQSIDDIRKQTSLTDNEQHTARDMLLLLGVIEAERRGMGRKWHYRIVIERIAELIDKVDVDEVVEPDGFEFPNCATVPPESGEPYPRKTGNRIPEKQGTASPKSGEPLTVNLTVNTVNTTERESPLNIPGKEATLDRRTSTLQALSNGIQRGVDHKMPSDVLDLYTAFIELHGRQATKSEKSGWIEAMREHLSMGITPADYKVAYPAMRKQGLTISSPRSLTTFAWDTHSKSYRTATPREVFSEVF